MMIVSMTMQILLKLITRNKSKQAPPHRAYPAFRPFLTQVKEFQTPDT